MKKLLWLFLLLGGCASTETINLERRQVTCIACGFGIFTLVLSVRELELEREPAPAPAVGASAMGN